MQTHGGCRVAFTNSGMHELAEGAGHTTVDMVVECIRMYA
jgi:hypothetical protein